MKKHTVKASVAFDFKGEHFSSSVSIDLDDFFRTSKDLSHCYVELGKAIGFDCYRYEYDVMESEVIHFSEPTGIAVDFVENGELDWLGLERAWQDHGGMVVIADIARKKLGIEDLDGEPQLAEALLAAYRAGRDELVVQRYQTGPF